MKHCGSANKPWCISLLEYLATPLRTGLPSPASMMGREFRGLLPHLGHFLPDSTQELLVHHHEIQVHPGGHNLPIIPIGSNVTFWIIDQENGTQRKCRIEKLIVTSL